ncbi:MAG: chorismate-binding protein, partial [Halobacteriovoraceae bacterium]|nr:chorismate-binding protein [Halobacteriovoraceae bacterium]
RVHAALEEIHSFESPISKIVLSRSLELRFTETLSPKNTFSQLKEFQNNTFNILFPLNESEFFFSFTPERILMGNGKQTFFEAIAGTKPRGNTIDEELAFEQELLESEKEAHEHREVVEQIADCVGQFGTLKIGKREVLKLRGIQHLKTPLQIKLRESDKENQLKKLAMTLHPTPAVGGTPQKNAKDFIFKTEGVRGPYAGLFGILSPEHTEIAVLIRSGIIGENKIKAFAGAGIVEGSDAESEWNETKQKFKSFLGDLI